jgi:hypothetical protein
MGEIYTSPNLLLPTYLLIQIFHSDLNFNPIHLLLSILPLPCF